MIYVVAPTCHPNYLECNTFGDYPQLIRITHKTVADEGYGEKPNNADAMPYPNNQSLGPSFFIDL